MRVTLNQDEIFDAVSDYLRTKLNLDNTASIEITFTAGRGPKGYSADVDITYGKSEQAPKLAGTDSGYVPSASEPVPGDEPDTQKPESPTSTAGAKDNLFQ